MSKFIKNIGKCRFNGYGADLYENKNGSAAIAFDKNCRSLPRKTRLTFDSIDSANDFIDSKEGSNGLNTLINILNHADIL